jgi:hypothetical protein
MPQNKTEYPQFICHSYGKWHIFVCILYIYNYVYIYTRYIRYCVYVDDFPAKYGGFP